MSNKVLTPKLFAVPLTLYVEAINEDMALAVANLYSFRITEHLRARNSSWITDKVTITSVTGDPIQVDKSDLPEESYNKEPLIKAFGEDRAIRFLNS